MKTLITVSLSFLALQGMAQKKMDVVRKSAYPLNDGDSLICYYFPLKSNMENPALPYYKEKPSLTDIVQVATKMPCDSFTVKRNGNAVLTINLKKDSTWQFTVREHATKLDTTFNSELIGAMTEHRTIELINNGYDKKAGQVFGKFNFNNQQIPYVTTKNMESAVLKVVDYFLYTKKSKGQ
ncbi:MULTISPECIES: hypothetical protein [Chitinophagaceae]